MRNLGILALIVLSGAAVGVSQTKKIERVPVKISGTIDGGELFQEYCAVCHGTDAKGGGPAADALKRPPTDLTQIARKNNGKFPELAVQHKIKGGDVREHGTAEMPIWGKVLISPGRTKTDADVRIYSLLRYVEKIQVK